MSRVLSRTVIVGGVIYPVGATVPGDVAEGITATGVWADGDQPTDPEPAPAPVGYAALTVKDLEAEIDKRNEDRDPEGEAYLSKDGKKADLVAVLEADDQA